MIINRYFMEILLLNFFSKLLRRRETPGSRCLREVASRRRRRRPIRPGTVAKNEVGKTFVLGGRGKRWERSGQGQGQPQVAGHTALLVLFRFRRFLPATALLMTRGRFHATARAHRLRHPRDSGLDHRPERHKEREKEEERGRSSHGSVLGQSGREARRSACRGRAYCGGQMIKRARLRVANGRRRSRRGGRAGRAWRGNHAHDPARIPPRAAPRCSRSCK